MKFVRQIFILAIAFGFLGCDIYTSSDRKKFEEDHMRTSSSLMSQDLQNKSLVSCATQSLGLTSERTREVGTYSPTESSSVYILRQHLIHGQWISELDNMNGVFCVYE